eukprot:m.314639 g.314639  ORF g.314639 m.314639 type:complete len:239 (+) comp16494_c4_seq19:2843-3559(+)
MEGTAYADVLASCGIDQMVMSDAPSQASGSNSGLCYVRNDLRDAFTGSVTVSLLKLSSGERVDIGSAQVTLPAGAGVVRFFCADGTTQAVHSVKPNCSNYTTILGNAGCALNGSDCIMQVSATSATPLEYGKVMSNNTLLLAPPHTFTLPHITLTASVEKGGTGLAVPVTVVCSEGTGYALYVWLSSLAQGRFLTNGFVLNCVAEEMVTVIFSFLSADVVDKNLLASSLRVEHLQQYL